MLPRKTGNIKSGIELFVQAHNAFGVVKMKFREGRDPKSKELPFSVFDFL